MKRILFFTLLGGLALCASAQLSVNIKGQLIAGKENKQSSSSSIGTSFGSVAQIDSLAQITVLGKGDKFSGGYISFGNGSDVTVGEKYLPSATWQRPSILTLKGVGGIEMIGLDGTVLYANDEGTRVNGDLQANGLFLSSDSRMKTNVESISDRIESLCDISGVSYRLSAKKSAATDSRTRFGFIAQEVKEYYPELVRTDENGYMSVDYVGFIPLLLESIKDLQKQVSDQQQIIATLTDVRKNKSASVDGNDVLNVPAMGQNRPNPFTETTVVDCTVPESVAVAVLYIYDLQGRQLLDIPVNGRGRTSVTVEASRLGAGMYIYSLNADGQEIATRRMIVNE